MRLWKIISPSCTKPQSFRPPEKGSYHGSPFVPGFLPFPGWQPARSGTFECLRQWGWQCWRGGGVGWHNKIRRPRLHQDYTFKQSFATQTWLMENGERGCHPCSLLLFWHQLDWLHTSNGEKHHAFLYASPSSNSIYIYLYYRICVHISILCFVVCILNAYTLVHVDHVFYLHIETNYISILSL